MKKLIPFILTLLPLLNSCKLEDNYTQTNVQEMVNVKDGVLINDNGFILHVKEDAVGASTWKIDGNRYLALFDILNRDLDIRLKDVIQAAVVNPSQYEEGTPYPADPLNLEVVAVSGGYLNLGFSYYKAKVGQTDHGIFFHDEVKERHRYLHISHEGNGEDPSQMDEKDLETAFAIFSLPLDPSADERISLVMNVLVTDGSGEKSVKEKTIDLY